jgi:hypothetical protein
MPHSNALFLRWGPPSPLPIIRHLCHLAATRFRRPDVAQYRHEVLGLPLPRVATNRQSESADLSASPLTIVTLGQVEGYGF